MSTPGVRSRMRAHLVRASIAIVHVDVRDLVIGDGERRARARVEHLVTELLAHGDQARARAARD